jgi:DNA-binding transcriptional LysR family regulator
MLSSGDLVFFSALARSASLAETARNLSVTAPAVSQRLRNLEERLGVRLVHRGARMSLTDEGEMLAEKADELLGTLEDITNLLDERRGIVRGHLRIAAPSGFGRRHIGAVIADFLVHYPEVRVTLELSDDPVGLKPEAWDVVVHIGAPASVDLQMVTLAPNRRLLCASPGYVERHGVPETPADLRQHRCMAIQENEEDVTLWRFTRRSQRMTLRIDPALQCNDGEVVRSWAIGGLGIIARSEWDVAADLETGNLVHVMPDWALPDAPIVALLGPKDGRTARVKRFVETLREAFSAPPWQRRSLTQRRGSAIESR